MIVIYFSRELEDTTHILSIVRSREINGYNE